LEWLLPKKLCYANGLITTGDTVDVVVCHKTIELSDNDGLLSEGVYDGIPNIYVCGKYNYKKKN